MAFKLLNTNRFYLPGTNALHIASVSDNCREYICFFLKGKIYIEEITGGAGPLFIEDDSLAQALSDFLHEKKVLHPSKPFLPDNLWYKKPKE